MATAKQRAAARRNLRKARAARRGKHRRATPAVKRALKKARAARRRNLRKPGHRRHRVKAYRYTRPRKRVRVRAHLSREEAPRRRRRRRGGKRRSYKRRRARASAYEAPRRRRRRSGRRKSRRRGRRRARAGASRRRGALENPLSGMEIFVGGLVGLATYGVYTMADRYIATRDSALVKSPSAPIYKDWMRLALGVGGSAIPIVIAHFIRSPVGRSSLQFAGLAVLFGFGGKLLEDVGAMLLKDNDTGKRLFAGEIFAQDALKQAEASKSTGTAGLPTGAGKPNDQAVPPPPAVFDGRNPSPAALAAVKKHHATLTALGAIAPHLEAQASGRATAEQLQAIEQVRVQHAEGLGELARFEEAELKAAAGLAGLTSAPKRESAISPPAKPQQKLVAPQFHWANNGEKDAA